MTYTSTLTNRPWIAVTLPSTATAYTPTTAVMWTVTTSLAKPTATASQIACTIVAASPVYYVGPKVSLTASTVYGL